MYYVDPAPAALCRVTQQIGELSVGWVDNNKLVASESCRDIDSTVEHVAIKTLQDVGL